MEKTARKLTALKTSIYAFIVVSIILTGCIIFCHFTSHPTTVILVRHAERTGTADYLNAQGISRSQELSRILDEADISAIYASAANRTQQTAAVLATEIGVNISIYNAMDLSSLVNEIKTNHKGEVVLVVGHSNTVPQTINQLGITPLLADIPNNEYDNLYIVTLCKCCDARMVKMEYGENSP